MAKFLSKGAHAYGLIEATPGHIYHWMLKLVADICALNVGIIEADKCETKKALYFWGEEFGYSYYADGEVWHSNKGVKYGDKLENGDVIHIWLDLKDKYELSFGQNEKKYGKAWDVTQDKTYKLAIAAKDGRIEILSFQIIG